MEQKKLNAKDLINVGVFTVIYIVLFYAAMMTGYIPIFIVLLPLIAPAICGIPFMLYLSKVRKFGMVTLSGTICGLLMMILGGGIFVFITGIVFGLLADLVLKMGRYTKIKYYYISHGIFSMWMMGFASQMFLTRDTYFAGMIDVYGQEYVNTLMSITPSWVFPLMFALCFVGGVLGSFIGKSTLNKHFKKAGIV